MRDRRANIRVIAARGSFVAKHMDGQSRRAFLDDIQGQVGKSARTGHGMCGEMGASS